MPDNHNYYTKDEAIFIASLLDSIIKNGYKSYIVTDSGIVSRLVVDKPKKIETAMMFLGYNNLDKILVVDDENKAIALFYLAGVNDRNGDVNKLIVDTEAAPKIRTRPEMWSKRKPKDCQKIIDKVIGEAKLIHGSYEVIMSR